MVNSPQNCMGTVNTLFMTLLKAVFYNILSHLQQSKPNLNRTKQTKYSYTQNGVYKMSYYKQDDCLKHVIKNTCLTVILVNHLSICRNLINSDHTYSNIENNLNSYILLHGRSQYSLDVRLPLCK